ncbi:MAG TPA: ATP-binding protein, partial [Ktedonobacterales bacterium]|nr:ATP-binding protein [Ktedonobacterales bacterium]
VPYLQAAAGDNARGHEMRRVESAAAASPICYHTGMELILFTGLQAAGKSTFYRERFAATHTLVSKDVLRNNPRPERRQQQLIAEALAAGRSVVVDNTNPTPEVRAPLIALGRQYGATIVGYSFASTAGESLARNRQRQGKARVPDVAIFATRKRLVPPSYAEGFDQLYAVRIADGGRFAIAPWT